MSLLTEHLKDRWLHANETCPFLVLPLIARKGVRCDVDGVLLGEQVHVVILQRALVEVVGDQRETGMSPVFVHVIDSFRRDCSVAIGECLCVGVPVLLEYHRLEGVDSTVVDDVSVDGWIRHFALENRALCVCHFVPLGCDLAVFL